MTLPQRLLTIGLCALATMLTRFLPFLVFSARRETPAFVRYLGQALPAAIFGMLVVYCLRNTSLATPPHALPELLALLIVAALHLWKHRTLLSIAVGTISYMLLIQFVF